MAPEAFVCPHCRTWVEGEGRSIRCPSCGKRFSTAEARLDRQRDVQHEALDYDVPERDRPAQVGWTLPDTRPTPAATDDWPQHHPWRSDETASSTDTYASERHEAPEPATWDYDDHSQAGDRTGESASDTSGARESIPWRWVLSAALLVLIFAGGRFLSGELFLVAFVALIAAQWFLGRNDDRE